MSNFSKKNPLCKKGVLLKVFKFRKKTLVPQSHFSRGNTFLFLCPHIELYAAARLNFVTMIQKRHKMIQ